MEQENRNQQNAAPQVSLGDQIKVRREKLAQLQAEGMDPFAIDPLRQHHDRTGDQGAF